MRAPGRHLDANGDVAWQGVHEGRQPRVPRGRPTSGAMTSTRSAGSAKVRVCVEFLKKQLESGPHTLTIGP
ncbi:hypothetical protein D9M72_434880 [compost metagenome]